jgi:hypothetical protein
LSLCLVQLIERRQILNHFVGYVFKISVLQANNSIVKLGKAALWRPVQALRVRGD